MQLLSVRLYQPDDVLTERIPDDSDGLSRFIRSLGAKLNQPEFENPPAEERALVVGISPAGRSIGWAIDRTGDLLNPDQQYLEHALQELKPPAVVGGAIVFAIHYSQAASGNDWIPLPKEWNDLAQAAGGALPVDELVMQCFESR